VERFIDLLLTASRTSPCTVILTVRADFYGEFLHHADFAAALTAGQVNLSPVGRDGLEAAIREPAEAVGLIADTPLVKELLDEVTADPGKLPLLEYALKETWQRREGRRLTLNDYGKAGGIDGAMAQRADRVYGSLTESQKTAARSLFVSLVTPGEGKGDARARLNYPPVGATVKVIQKFADKEVRLLVTGEDEPSGRRIVEISHESLIRRWDQLKDWVEANRDALRRFKRVREQMRQWSDLGSDPTALLPPGLLLEEGRGLLADHGDVLIDDVREYIEASIAADEAKVEREQAAARRQLEQQRTRTRVAVSLGTVALVFAIGAGWLWNKASDEADRANTERSHAERNLALPQRAANGLVFDLVDGLKPLSGVSNETIRRILGRADTLLEELAGGETASPSMRRLRAATLLQFADAYLAQGDLAAAGAAAEQGRQILDLLAQDQSDEQAQRDLSISWNKLGEVRQAQGDLPGALRAYDDARTIRAKLAAADPGNAEWQRDLSVSWEKLGSVHEEQENRADALKAWRAALAVSGRLPENFPDSIDMVTTPVIHLAGVARTLDPADAQAPAEAARLLDRALALLRPLDEAGRLDAERHDWIAWIEQQRTALKQP